MKYKLDNSTITILEHIVHMFSKIDKVIHFCFQKGTNQSFCSVKQIGVVTFKLKKPIPFEYPIADLKEFLEIGDFNLDSENLIADKRKLNLNNILVKRFITSKYFDESKLKFENYKLFGSTKKHYDKSVKASFQFNRFNYVDFIGQDKKLYLRFQNYRNKWWLDKSEKIIVEIGKVKKKFRQVISTKLLERLFPTDYNLIFRRGYIQFNYKHLNYYLKLDNEWYGKGVRDFFKSTHNKDKHLLERFRKLKFI